MSKVIIKVHVAYPSELLRTFNTQRVEREANGERQSAVCFRPDNPNITFFILDWESVESAKRFWSSSVSKGHIAEWRAVDTPEVDVLEQFVQQ